MKCQIILLVFFLVFPGLSPAQISPEMYVDGREPIPNKVLDIVAALLPESSNAGAQFISDQYSPNLYLAQDADLKVIFVHEGAGYRNSLGYFTFETLDESPDYIISSRQLIFPDASFPKLSVGDVSVLRDNAGTNRRFEAGDNIGFFLAANGYRFNQIRSFDPLATTLPSADAQINRLGSGGYGVFTTIDSLNPEKAENAPVELHRHVAMIKVDGIEGFLDGEDFFLVGFEDLKRNRNSDEDFNDLVFIVQSNPPEAIITTNVLNVSNDIDDLTSDVDGDGIEGIEDQFPADPELAFSLVTPAQGVTVVGFEDQYPKLGDRDYNDVVFSYKFRNKLNAQRQVKEIEGSFDLMARGAHYDHLVGVHISGIPDSVTGTVQIESFLSDKEKTRLLDVYTLEEFRKNSGRISIFESTRAALPPLADRSTVNTNVGLIDHPAASTKIIIRLDQAIDEELLGAAPYDLFVSVRRDGELYDVHFPGKAGFGDRPGFLPEESGADSFLAENGFPWLLEVPNNWRFPLERVNIADSYPEFTSWVLADGKRNLSWHRSVDLSKVSAPFGEYLTLRNWTH